MNQQLINLLRDIKKTLTLYNELGINEYSLSSGAKNFLNAGSINNPHHNHEPRPDIKTTKIIKKQPLPLSKTTLHDVLAEFNNCTRCTLCKTRNHIMTGDGKQHASLFIIGESPTDEDEQKRKVLCGDSGKLLDKMLTAIKMSRQNVFITTLVKCHPPQNRPPFNEEINACHLFLSSQIAAVAPKVICTMGQLAAQSLLKTDKSLLQLRGRMHKFKGIALVPTFHPNFLIKNQEMKKAAWIDLQLIQKLCFTN